MAAARFVVPWIAAGPEQPGHPDLPPLGSRDGDGYVVLSYAPDSTAIVRVQTDDPIMAALKASANLLWLEDLDDA